MRYRRSLLRLFVFLLLDIVLLAAFAAMVWFDNSTNRGITYTPDPTHAPLHWEDGPVVGVNVYNLHMEPDPAVVTKTLQLVHDLGVRYVRMQMPWDDIEIHGWGDFEDRRNVEEHGVISSWAKYDRIVEIANNFDIELIARLDRPPDWAREEAIERPAFQEGLERDGNSTGPPDDYSDYSAFVSSVVERYRGKVRFFQIWNEPNLKNEWNWQEPSPEDFADLLRIGYDAAKRANPDAVILFPALAPVDGLDKRAPMTELEYLDRVYEAGGGKFFDIMSAQSYGLGQPPDEHRYVRLRPFDNWNWLRPFDTRTDVSRIVLLREVMERHGDDYKEIWISEMGWNSAPDTIPAERRFTWGQPVSEEQKADYLIGQIERARQEWTWMGVMNIWVLRYGGYLDPDPNDPTPYFALVGRDWEKLPAYTKLQAYLAQPTVAGVGNHHWNHPAIEQTANGWIIRFAGTYISLIGGPSDIQKVLLDGQEIALVRDGLPDGREVLTTPALPNNSTHVTHTLAIVAPAATPPELFVVGRQAPLAWFWTSVPALLIIALLISGAMTMPLLFAAIKGNDPL